jgi:peptidoglycan/LPS O-acetylase OafA/YrhL
MLIIGTAFALFQSFTPGTNNPIREWQYLHLMPVAHYWFLESLFLIFIVILLLEHFKALETTINFAIIFIISAIAFVSNVGTPWFSIAGAFYLFPYFLAGLYFTRFPLQLTHPRATGYIAITIVILFLVFFGHEYGGGRRSINALITGLVACSGLLLTKAESTKLAAIGNYSYSIYLFHVFFTAASRIGLTKIGVSNIWLLFVAGTAAGLIGPIIVELVVQRNNTARTLLLGKS